jgi:hypothetical protein
MESGWIKYFSAKIFKQLITIFLGLFAKRLKTSLPEILQIAGN